MNSEAVSIASCAPFDSIAEQYDEIFTHSVIGSNQRQQVWRAAERVFRRGDHILELNCGTGVDAIWFAKRGIHVTAFDQSPRMIAVAHKNLTDSRLTNDIHLGVLDNSDLSHLSGCFDGAFSNFSGLNCVPDLEHLAADLARLLRPKASLLVCLSARYCVWETLWYAAHLRFDKVFRRLRRGGSIANVGGHKIWVQYPNLGTIRRLFRPYFSLQWARGIGILVPPTYFERTVQAFPSAVAVASKIDGLIAGAPILREMADHLLVCLVRSAL